MPRVCLFSKKLKCKPCPFAMDVPSVGTPISSIDELELIGTSPDYPLGGDYYLTNDIIASGPQYITLIGTSSAPFTGTFNGKGHTISGFNIQQQPITGLFGVINNAIITDLNVNCTVSISGASILVGAGIVGESLGGSIISGCTNGSSIYVNSTGGGDYCFAGGIVGYANDGDVLRDCMNAGSVTGLSASSSGHAGGIVGAVQAGIVSIIDVLSVGTVNAQGTAGNTFAGGILCSDGAVATSNIVNGYYLSGSVYVNSVSHDNLVGKVNGTSIIDGVDNPLRTSSPDQNSGAKVQGDLQPTPSVAQTGGSVYYIGSTSNLVGTFKGFDFSKNWGFVTPTGYPMPISGG